MQTASSLKTRVALAFAAIIVALAVLLLLKTCPGYRWFQIGEPVLSVHGVRSADLANIALHRDRYYEIAVESDAATPLALYFTYPDHTTSKVIIIGQTPADSGRAVTSVLQVREEAPAAAVTIAPLHNEPPQAITFRSLTISELDGRYYLYRNILQAACCLTLLVASFYLAWRLYGRMATIDRSLTISFRSLHPATCWAVLLLALGGGFDGFFLKHRHQGLFDAPLKPSIKGWDDSFYYFWLRSAMVDRDLDFTNDVLYCNTLTLAHRQDIIRDTPRTATGLLPNKYPIGFALLSIPWYAAGSITTHLANLFGEGVLHDGWGPVYQFCLVVGQVIYATAGLYFAYRILNEYFSPAIAACAVLFGWLGSPLIFYQTIDVFMSHNVMFFAMTGAYFFSYRLIKQPEKLVYWLLVGLLSAFVILARYQGAIMLLFPGVVCLREVFRDRRRLFSFAIAIIAGAVPLALQAVAWKIVFGSYFLYTYQGETFSWRHPHLYEVLFSPFHGLFNWHPMMLVGFVGFLAWAAFSPRSLAAVCFMIPLALAIYINGAWDCWWFGASFGSRAFETCTLFSMLGIGYLLSLMLRRSLAFHALSFALLLPVFWNMNLMWLVFIGRLPLEKPLTWPERIEISNKHWSRPA